MGLFDKLKGKKLDEAKGSAEDKVKEAQNEKEEKTEPVKEVAKPSVATPSSNSVDRDFTGTVHFLSQFTEDVGDVDGDGDHDRNDENIACCKASKLMIQRAGFKTVNADKRIDVGVFNIKMDIVKTATTQKGYELLDQNCDHDMPTLTGVNRKKKSVGNANAGTSHFVAIVARRLNQETGNKEYRFYDPGTSYENKGTDKDQWFTLDGDGLFRGTSKYCDIIYTITEIRPTFK